METTSPVIFHISDPRGTHCPEGNILHQPWDAKGLEAGPTIYWSLTVVNHNPQMQQSSPPKFCIFVHLGPTVRNAFCFLPCIQGY